DIEFTDVGDNWAVAPACTDRSRLECHILVGNFNQDKRADFAEFDRRSGTINVYVNLNGRFGSAQPAGTACTDEGACDVLVGDFDGDSLDDIAEHSLRTGTLRIHLNRGPGRFFDSAIAYTATTCAAGDCEVLGDGELLTETPRGTPNN